MLRALRVRALISLYDFIGTPPHVFLPPADVSLANFTVAADTFDHLRHHYQALMMTLITFPLLPLLLLL
jgi:hypothetical protein